ncbi:MAG: hypothetical protein IIC75_08530 [Bacteroidetes bacterium]|nr:hypothetical protein [Bacteroidota bacterium]
MKCIYCNKELPKVVNSRRDVCDCKNAQEEHLIGMNIQHAQQWLEEGKKKKIVKFI